VRLFRRREPLHVQLAREGGLIPPDPRPPWQETGIHGIAQAREWDVTATADAPALDGDALEFVVLPDDDLEPALAPLADALDLPAPYRARAARQSGSLWAVQARQIEVVELPTAPEGDSIELTPDGLLVDGERVFGSIPELEGLGDVVRADRLDGDLWEVQVGRL
jgi:hypothetical protein